jgi:hypothetical protein
MAYGDKRIRNANLDGDYALRGVYRLSASSGAVTTIAAATATAGHLFAFRWTDTTLKAYIRYIGARFILTTAYSAAQETGCDLIMARAYSASHTSGTAIDTGGTVTGSGKYQTSQLASLVADCRIATTAALTAGTHTLDANPIASLTDWSGAVGDTIPRSTSGAMSGPGALWDARDYRFHTPLELAANEGFVIRNKILMGASGVGRWDFTVIWDEGTPNRT